LGEHTQKHPAPFIFKWWHILVLRTRQPYQLIPGGSFIHQEQKKTDCISNHGLECLHYFFWMLLPAWQMEITVSVARQDENLGT
jgi:hypothetical protein